MRPTRILLVASLALSLAAPADGASPGVCVDSSAGVNNECLPPLITCQRGDRVNVVVAGIGAGLARCGDATGFCTATATAPACTGSDGVLFGGTLQCDVDPYGNYDAVAVCFVTTAVDN